MSNLQIVSTRPALCSGSGRMLASLFYLSLNSAAALAQTIPTDFPNRIITFVVPLAAGGPADITARILAQKMSETIGQQVIVENIGGGSGQIALNKVARAKADGHTLLFTTGSFLTVVPHLFPKANIEPLKMFEPISIATSFPTVLVTSTKLPVKDLSEFIAYAKANPDKLNFSSPGAGSNPHLAVEAAKKTLGFQAAHVPYRGGGPALAAVVAGEVEFACTEPSGLAAQLPTGKVRAIAVAGNRRHPALPDVPTFAELGFPELEFKAWTGLLAPTGTPPDIITRLNDELAKALRSTEVVARFEAMKIEAYFAGPDDLRQTQIKESAMWKPLIAGLGLAQE